MTAVPKTKLTPAEYLAIERRAEFKSEFYRGEMFTMAGARHVHNRIKENLIGELHAQFKGGPCESFSSDQRVKVDATGLYTYPDIVIICEQTEFEDEERDTLLNPRVIIEVLSESTENYDRGTKALHYMQLPSLQEYVLVSQRQPVVERHVRQPDGSWNKMVYSRLDATLEFASVPAKVALADICRGVEFPEATLR